MSILGGARPTAQALVLLRTPWLFDIALHRCVGMATANHGIRFKRSTLILLNVPYWKSADDAGVVDRLVGPDAPARGIPQQDSQQH